MKHIELFENFEMGDSSMSNSPAQLLVMGDWGGITKDGIPLEFVAPATFIVKYLPPGSEILSGDEMDAEDPYTDLEDIAEDIFTIPYVDFDKTVRYFIDPSLSPKMIESYLKSEADRIWTAASDEEYYMILSSGDPNTNKIYEPNYLRLASMDKPFPRKVIFTMA
jgi:hypothetical protein